jgi:fumarate hydratase class II
MLSAEHKNYSFMLLKFIKKGRKHLSDYGRLEMQQAFGSHPDLVQGTNRREIQNKKNGY